MDDSPPAAEDAVVSTVPASAGDGTPFVFSPAHKGPPKRWDGLRQRVTELLIVFLGVYAAFWLNRLDSEHRDTGRRRQIIQALDRETASTISQLRLNVGQAEADFTKFQKLLADGAMPPVGIAYSNSDYSASDDATLLQAGGLELLDVETIEQVRNVNSMQRSLVDALHNQFELSLAEFSNRSPDEFYDPATRQLKPRYRWYPVVIGSILADAKRLIAAGETLLTHLRSKEPAAPPAKPLPANGHPER